MAELKTSILCCMVNSLIVMVIILCLKTSADFVNREESSHGHAFS